MSDDIIRQHLDKMMSVFTTGAYYDDLIKAKTKYFEMIGVISDEDKDFEPRMNAFNDWYLFQYVKDDTFKPIEDYMKMVDLDDEMSKSFFNVNYSLFQVFKLGNRKQVVLEDILHGEKITLALDHEMVALVDSDLFTGRVLFYKGQYYMLRGVSLIPRQVLPILRKQAKKIRKLNNIREEISYLLKVEHLNTKSKNYGHISVTKIFTFN